VRSVIAGDVEAALALRYGKELQAGETIRIEASTGPGSAFVRASVGPEARPHRFEVFARGIPGEGLDGALGVVLDFLDGALTEYFDEHRDAYLPLDFVGHPYEGHVVFARSELRDLEAEAAARALLGDEYEDED